MASRSRGSLGRCLTHDKLSFWTRQEAKNHAREHHSSHKSTYYCEETNCYHVGELAAPIISGDSDRKTIYRGGA